jgi:hypothetical protein
MWSDIGLAALAPLLFDEDLVVEDSQSLNETVADSKRSKKSRAKRGSKKTEPRFPVHSFQTLMDDLGTIARNRIESTCTQGHLSFEKITEPTPLQQRALDLLSVSLICTQ